MATRVETEVKTGQVLPSLVKDVSQRRIDLWVENQDGEKTAVGHASGLVS